MTIADQLAAFAFSLTFDHLPDAVIHETKRRVIDSIGCALGAFEEEPCMIARRMARSVQDSPSATLLGTATKTIPDLAAFANGTMVRYLDYNDTYLSREPAHPSDNFPVALAMTESEGANGKDLITALVIGYEIQCRLCDAATLRTRGWDHVTYGPFSTCLVASKLMKLPKERMVQAVNLAGVSNIALRQTRVGELSMWKGSAFANAARNGIFAAELARQGMTGPSPIFEGEKGFFRGVSGPFELPPLAEKGVSFRITDTCIKKFPAEYHAQSAIEAALLLRSTCPPKDILSITVKTFDVAREIIGKDPEKWEPQSRETADHSLPYLVAVAWMDGKVGLDQFTEERIRDPLLRSLIQKVSIEVDPDLNAVYPEAMPNQVDMKTVQGQVHHCKVTYPHGHPKRPLSDEELEEKFISLARPRIPMERIRRLLDQLWHLDSIQQISELLPLCHVEAKGIKI